MSDYIVGIDEVGRGSLVGSAVVCAFRADDQFFQTLPFEAVSYTHLTLPTILLV